MLLGGEAGGLLLGQGQELLSGRRPVVGLRGGEELGQALHARGRVHGQGMVEMGQEVLVIAGILGGVGVQPGLEVVPQAAVARQVALQILGQPPVQEEAAHLPAVDQASLFLLAIPASQGRGLLVDEGEAAQAGQDLLLQAVLLAPGRGQHLPIQPAGQGAQTHRLGQAGILALEGLHELGQEGLLLGHGVG